MLHCLILGRDFNLTNTIFVFNSEITQNVVPIEIYDDDLVEGTETFFICLPDLDEINMDAMLVNDALPNCVTILIEDNDSKELKTWF